MKTFSALLLSALLSGSAAWVLMDQRSEEPGRPDSSVVTAISPGSADADRETAPGFEARSLVAGILASGAGKGSEAPEAVSARTDSRAGGAQAGAASREPGARVADHVSGGASRFSAP